MKTIDHATPPIEIRAASPDDIVEAAQVYQLAARGLSDAVRARDPWRSTEAREADLRQAITFLARARQIDPDGVIVAESDSDLVGVACVRIHGDLAIIVFVFVTPTAQNRGVGESLISALEARIARAGATTVVLHASADTRAWQRYLRMDMRVGAPTVSLETDALAAPSPPPPAAVRMIPIDPLDPIHADAIASIDARVRGAPRNLDIHEWLANGAHGELLFRPHDQQPVGYFLISTSLAANRIGPVVAVEPGDFDLVLTQALGHAANLRTPSSRWRVDVPGANTRAIQPLLNAGFRPRNLLTWFQRGTIGQWDRYVFRDEDHL